MALYHILDVAVDTKETGPYYPQAKLFKKYDDDAPDSAYQLNRESYLGFPDFVPNLNYFEVGARSKLTDLMSQVPLSGLKFMLVSPKFKDLLEKHNLVPHRFYNATVKHKEVFYDYYVMQIHCDLTDFVDWPNSKFRVFEFSDIIKEIKIDSKTEWIKIREEVRKINISHKLKCYDLQLIDSFDKDLDLFTITTSALFDGNTYISKKLADNLLKNHITGVNIENTVFPGLCPHRPGYALDSNCSIRPAFIVLPAAMKFV
jgi:hypothetical protein